MNMHPTLSIVVPVHNTEKYLPETMRSICAQPLTDMEIVCVDDCSTDASPAILRDFASRDPRIRIVTHPENLGEALARKRGMSESRGEYLMFVDWRTFARR